MSDAGIITVSLAVPLISGSIFNLMSSHMPAVGRIYQSLRLFLGLFVNTKPDLVLISQGGNFDGVMLANVCRFFKLPCLILSHKASEMQWPADSIRPFVKRMYQEALWCFFVSRRNHALTEQQLALSIPEWTLARNPFSVPWNASVEWPTGDGLHLACVGRLDVRDKGQDVLMHVLAMEKWRARAVSVTFCGGGAQTQSLRELAAWLGLTSVRFDGVVPDPSAIWAEHHALILPSRAEGLPLTIVEAMLSDRIVITTDAGGNAEIVEDGITGFIAPAATVDMIDAVLERAWQRRGEWQAMGRAAGEAARAKLEEHPAEVFADTLAKFAERVSAAA